LERECTSGGTLAGVFAERQDHSVAVPDDELALSVDPVLGSLEDIGAARA
jgi:hypothetical protein